MIKNSYTIAQTPFSISMNEKRPLLEELDAYAPFLTENSDNKELFFSLKVGDYSDFEALNRGEEFICELDADILTVLAYKHESGYKIELKAKDNDQIEAVIYTSKDGECSLGFKKGVSRELFLLNNSLMVLFTLFSATNGVVLFHSSVALYHNKGYLFLGKSGTGKSTHNRMWREASADVELLNDDNPAVRIDQNGKAIVYGTPWSGKTPCYRNEMAEIDAISRIVRAPHNKVKQLSVVESYASLLPTVSSIKWDKECSMAIHKTLERVITSVSCYSIECLPNIEAAKTAMEAIVKE